MKLLQAPGKLMISAEYMVLYGSRALALPLKKGQTLQRIRSDERNLFSWKAFWGNKLWFSAIFNPVTLAVQETTDQDKAAYLHRLLKACIDMDPTFQKELFTWDVETRLDFSPDWGFGSSSSLTALMAEWVEVNPLDLHFMISEGSGYDVACAVAGSAIIYTLGHDGPHYRPVSFNPTFAEQIYFVWLGSKQATASHLAGVASSINPGKEDIRYFTTLTQGMLEAGELYEFRLIMEEHEARLSEIIKRERVSNTHFSGLQGSVKSLGAWGGDFVMIASDQEPLSLYKYLDELGLTTRFRFKELIYEV